MTMALSAGAMLEAAFERSRAGIAILGEAQEILFANAPTEQKAPLEQ